MNDASDPGGETKYGISKRAYPNLDIQQLSLEQAREICRRDYWDRCRCDEFPGPVALTLFDAAVHQGAGRAIRLLQSALGLTADGVIGPVMIRAARSLDQRAILQNFLAKRAVHYAKRPTFRRFGSGWMRRLFALQAAALRYKS